MQDFIEGCRNGYVVVVGFIFGGCWRVVFVEEDGILRYFFCCWVYYYVEGWFLFLNLWDSLLYVLIIFYFWCDNFCLSCLVQISDFGISYNFFSFIVSCMVVEFWCDMEEFL